LHRFKAPHVSPFRVVEKLGDGTFRVQKVHTFKDGGERYQDQEKAQRLLAIGRLQSRLEAAGLDGEKSHQNSQVKMVGFP
jgi:hypothetical protein